jgi:flagellar basal body-associated protein FliL
MEDNRVLFYIIVGFLFVVTLTNVYLVLKIDSLKEQKISGMQVSGEYRLCLLDGPPSLFSMSTDCNETLYEYQTMECDFNPDVFFLEPQFSSYFSSDTELFSVSAQGSVNFTANQTYVGNHSYTVLVIDVPGCGNRMGQESYDLEIINVNDAPVFSGHIRSQEWSQDTSWSPFDLDAYFSDQDGDDLRYTSFGTTRIQVSIDENNEVTFIPDYHWYGTEFVTFVAWDPYNLTAYSNVVRLRVQQTENADEGSSGGGGGSGGSGGEFSGILITCLPQWFCSDWGPCLPESIKRRTCTDQMNCSVPLNKPNETEACEYVHTCFDGIKGPLEEGVDCGGPCIPCPSCFDGIKNQGETGVDCGGPCDACPQNGTGLTPGMVSRTESPLRIQREDNFLYSMLIFILIGTLLAVALSKAKNLKVILPAIAKRHKLKKMSLAIDARETLLERLEKLEKKIPRTRKEDIIVEFAEITRDYFKSLFGIAYEFTNEELVKELEQRSDDDELKKILIDFFKRSTEFEFSGKSGISKKAIQERIYEFRKIIELTAIEHQDIPRPKSEMERLQASQIRLERFLLKVSNAHLALKMKDLDKAYKIYLELIHDYRYLTDSEKARVISFINGIHSELRRLRSV